MPVTKSATLAANEVLAERRSLGHPVLPMAFGEAGLPVHPAVREALAAGSDRNAYGPVAGTAELREAAAGYWMRRGMATDPRRIVAGPGSKPLLYGLLLSLGGGVAMAAPSWVSYAAQTRLSGNEPVLVPTPPAQGGVPEPELLAEAVLAARERGNDVRAVVVTLPDNPTATVASQSTVRRLAHIARELDLVVISDEIYRDLVYDAATTVHSPVEFAPERTVVTTGVSKSLALGGWRLGVLRVPDGDLGEWLYERLVGVASEIWSSPAAPVQRAAAYALNEPPELVEHTARSRRLHGIVARAVTDRFVEVGAMVVSPQAAFYLYPDFQAWRERLAADHGVTTGPELSELFLRTYGLGVLPAAAFGESRRSLRLRVATGLLYGDTDVQRCSALAADDPISLPWVRGYLERLSAVLRSVAPRGTACAR